MFENCQFDQGAHCVMNYTLNLFSALQQKLC